MDVERKSNCQKGLFRLSGNSTAQIAARGQKNALIRPEHDFYSWIFLNAMKNLKSNQFSKSGFCAGIMLHCPRTAPNVRVGRHFISIKLVVVLCG